MKYTKEITELYVIIIEDLKNDSKFRQYVLTSTTNLVVANEIVDILNICLNKNFKAFWQREYI